MPRRQKSFRPRFETLEERRVLSAAPMFEVSPTTQSAGYCLSAQESSIGDSPANEQADTDLKFRPMNEAGNSDAHSRFAKRPGAAAASRQRITPFPGFQGGVRVAAGDVNGDGTPDIVTAPGPGAGPHVRVFDGATGRDLRSFSAFDEGFTGGVFVAVGDVNGDGVGDIITGAGPGGSSQIKVFDGLTGKESRSFFAFPQGFTGGVTVASGDVNGDGVADIITGAGAGGGPHVKVFDGLTGAETQSFLAYSPTFSGGVYVAAADVNNDGLADIITGAGQGAGPHVKVFDAASGRETHSFFAYETSFSGGVRVATGDVNGDGVVDIITGAGPGGGPHVKVFSGADGTETRSFFAYNPFCSSYPTEQARHLQRTDCRPAVLSN